MDERVEVIPLPGFDPVGEPEIRRSADGRLSLVFNFMPPSWVPDAERADLGRFAAFDRELERAVGTPVVWEDRESFRIDRPGEDTVEAIRRFLADYRRRHDAGGEPAPANAGPAEPSSRVVGYDLARSAALLGMVVVHFSLVAAADRSGPGWMAAVLALLDGRAAATFVILAGVGVTLMTRRAVAGGDPAALAEARDSLARRGWFLLAVGFVNLLVWQGDILRVYGVSLLLASRLIAAPGRRLLGLAVGFALVFAALVVVGDFEKNWDWQRLRYRHLWRPTGAVRNLFYDGFRSVLPWTGFVLYGMWLGRLDLTDRRVARRVLLAAVGVAAAAEGVSRLLVGYFVAHPRDGLDAETVQALFGTESLPALPLFLLAAGGAATAVIVVCVRLTAAWPSAVWKPFAATGRLALTWYVAHILFGLGTLVAVGAVGTEPLPVAAGYGLTFFAGAVLASWAWTSRFRLGPLEWVIRKTAG